MEKHLETRELWRKIVNDMDGEDIHKLLTPEEELRWLRLVVPKLPIPPLTRSEILDRAAIVLAESRGAPPGPSEFASRSRGPKGAL
jgi:hypothetical protein